MYPIINTTIDKSQNWMSNLLSIPNTIANTYLKNNNGTVLFEMYCLNITHKYSMFFTLWFF